MIMPDQRSTGFDHSSQADTLWEYLLAVVQGLFWPAFMVYEVFKALRRSG